MRKIKKIIVFILIIIMVLSILVFAEPPSQYGPYPDGPSEYIYKTLHQTWSSSYVYEWYILSLNKPQIKLDSTGIAEFDLYFPPGEAIVYYKLNDDWQAINNPEGALWSKDAYSILYTNYDMYDFNRNVMIHYADDTLPPPPTVLPTIDECTIYTIGIGDTINIDNNSLESGFFYFRANNATFEELVAIGTEYPTVNTYENLSSGEWEWMEPEPDSNYNYWKVTSGTIDIGIPNDSSLVVKTTTKAPDGGYDINPSPDRIDYEDSIFGTISYGIDTLVYWISYPFVAVGEAIVGVIDEIKLNLNWLNDFSSIVAMLFGWIPERFQGLLYICVSATVISFIIRVFRGS